MLRQREPRVQDKKHLEFIRTLPCCVCKTRHNVDAAHIRTANIKLGKRQTGMAEKPDDKWTLPLCRNHHTQQHGMNEMEFYKLYRIDPFFLANSLRQK